MFNFRKVDRTHDVATGTVISETWWKKGKLDRKDDPAIITRDAVSGIVTSEGWYKNGKRRDRTEGPAFISRDAATGAVTYESWCDAATGTVIFESWCKDGKLNRTDGPALIERNAAPGTVIYEAWFRDDRQIPPPARPAAPEKALRPYMPKPGCYADLNL